MHPLVGLHFDGPTLTSFDDVGPGQGAIGKPVWGPAQLLRDLELRLGLNTAPSTPALRVACWAARMTQLAPRGHFYARSFDVDAWGTANAVLGLRDALVEANWRGEPVTDGGHRLTALAELEALSSPTLPPGDADRLVAVARALAARPWRIYAELSLAEAPQLWPSGYQSIFQSLAQAGTVTRQHVASLPGASPDTDLGKVQAALSGTLGATRNAEPLAPAHLQGDGTLVYLTAETSWEAAQAAAALLAMNDAQHSVVIREGDAAALEHALMGAGLASQGTHGTSPWRTAPQVLPLCLELAFEPKDPARVLELLTLPAGPFADSSGHRLARALARSPGIGSPTWERVKAELTPPQRERLAEWLEMPGWDAATGASTAELQCLVSRVRDWLVARSGDPKFGVTLGAAIGHCDAWIQALAIERRPALTLVEARRLAEFVSASSLSVPVTLELAGRIPQVTSAVNLWSPRPSVLWWSFNQRHVKNVSLPWRRQELAALAQAGVSFPDPRLLLLEQAQGERRALLAASERLILVAPRTRLGEQLAPHPLWDEVIARLQLDAQGQATVTLSTVDLLTNATGSGTLLRSSTLQPHTEVLSPLALPGGHAEWCAKNEPWQLPEIHSASSLNALLGCPLQWGLQYRAGLRSEVLRLPGPHLLNGMLGHRLIEVLHEQNAFSLAEPELTRCISSALDGLLLREGAMLLQPGKASERSQVRRQLTKAVCALARVLRDNGLRIIAVEKDVLAPWHGSQFTGRIDVLAGGDTGESIIIDVKWGYAAYRDLLKAGETLQLAGYVFALSESKPGETPESNGIGAGLQRAEAAYFTLKKAMFIGPVNTTLLPVERVPGPDLRTTWQRVERTVSLAAAHVASGRFPVVGLSQSLPLLTSLGVAPEAQAGHFALNPTNACKYCGFDGLCGRRWQQEQLHVGAV